MCVGIYVTVMRGSVMGFAFSGVGFVTKSIGMIFFVWLGIQKLGMDYQIFVPMICFFWFFTHLVEAFVIQHYIQKNVPQQLQNLQIKQELIMIELYLGIAFFAFTFILAIVMYWQDYKDFFHFQNFMYYLLKVKWWFQDMYSLLYNMNQLRLYKKHLKMRIKKNDFGRREEW